MVDIFVLHYCGQISIFCSDGGNSRSSQYIQVLPFASEAMVVGNELLGRFNPLEAKKYRPAI